MDSREQLDLDDVEIDWRALRVYEARGAYQRAVARVTALTQTAERVRMELRHAVIMESANVDCMAVRDGGG